MSALAKILLKFGKNVAGYDREEGEYTQELSKIGVCVTFNPNCDVSGYDAVVYTDALPENSPAIIQARRLNKVLIPRGELLYEVSRAFKRTVAVAGCHGKTTCTAMIAHIFAAAGKAFSLHVGGNDISLSNAFVSGADYFITEACEYKKNFLYLKPDFAVILNSDADHLDCYGSAKNLKSAYMQFAQNAGDAVKLYGDLPEVNCSAFGFDDRATYYAKKIKNVNGKFSFTAYEENTELGSVSLAVCGKHNVLNALAAIAVAQKYGIPFGFVAQGLQNFKGVKRRFEKIGRYNGAVCIADYAHHPNEIKAAIKTAKLVTRGEVFVVFQPHTYSRTKNLFKQFTAVLSTVKKLMVYKTYAAREYYDDAGSALTLAGAIKRSHYGENISDILRFISSAGEDDAVLFLGAGDIYEIAKNILRD